jgi:hypothetical protein
MDEWDYYRPNTLEFKFEDIIGDAEGTLLAAFAFIGLLSDTKDDRRRVLQEAIRNNAFAKLSGGRTPGEENVMHHYRHGVVGDWRRYFSVRHKRWFEDRYPQLLIKMGYEADNSW